MTSKQKWLSDEQVLTLNERHGWFRDGDAQSGVSRAFANDAVAAHEQVRAAAPELLAVALAVVEAWNTYERFGPESTLECSPLIHATVLEELFEKAAPAIAKATGEA
jgi:hypothetical protein